VVIHSFSHIQDAEIGGGCSIGPYARLRPGSLLDNDVKVGNFVEIKGSHLHRGVKVNHLSYIGDAEVGSESNIGAGVVFCNYDGDQKHKTHVGKKSFIGSNVSLVAPLSIGNKVCVGAGSTITKDIPDDSLAICRAKDMVLKNK
jgi:bifunctional UDP-N-acetylglucosamine pyrophosphorylase/glucosamine-1-phosphate N-acetyltransferase